MLYYIQGAILRLHASSDTVLHQVSSAAVAHYMSTNNTPFCIRPDVKSTQWAAGYHKMVLKSEHSLAQTQEWW
jgi:hypothetical protein